MYNIFQRRKFLYLDDDAQIVECIAEFQARGFPLTMSQVRFLGWQFAYVNGFPGIPLDKKKLGRSWAWGLFKHFPQLTCRKAVNLSVAKAIATNELNVRKWLTEYKKVLSDLKINSPEQIWSGDQTGIQNIPKEEVVVCVKEKKGVPNWSCRPRRNFNSTHICKWSW